LILCYNPPCDYVIYTVVVMIYNKRNDALCCISTREFYFSKDKAAPTTWEIAMVFLKKYSNCMEQIIFNVFKDSDCNIYEKNS